ncbi:MAG: hypothetical protein K5705_13140 [Oscillospiraceae bacterium]|nr:hypothetical protein [Oscillospiraceae bacterium]
MSYIEDIKAAILKLDSASYQKFCDEFLNECGYSNIVGLGSKPSVNKTTLGTPDTYICHDANGKYIFIEYTTQQASIYSKISSDIIKCLDETFTHINCDRISEIWYFHTTSNLTPEQDAELKGRCEAKGILLKIYGIDYFANELYNRHKYLVKQHLGIAIATEQILSYGDFVRAYNQAKTAAPIDTEFKFRNEEINSVINALEDNKAVLLCGVAGVGKTRLALECCRRYAEQNKYQIFCIRNNNQPIYEDLHLYFRSAGSYVILIDDANELTHLDTILNFINEHNDSNFKIVLTVRNYAAREISATIKPLLNLAIYNILPLKDEEIKELLKNNYGILNPLFLDRIIKVAEGNARIALLAGKIAVESNSLESIKDVASIYDSYYGQHLSKLGISDDLLLVAGIAAFVGAIHLDHLDALNDIISLCGMNSDRFIESLNEIHNTEIIDIYKSKAVKFSDQCLSNYLLYYVFIERKLFRLSDMIRYTFKANKSQTINSINVLTQLYFTTETREYLMSELRDLWARLEKEDQVYFWEYVKVFYLVNPTDSLLLVKRRIENTNEIIKPIDELTIDERNTTASDDILTILGGFANREELDTALDLYFLYFQKRPDLLQQFYNTAINCYGIGYDDFVYDYRSLILYIRKLVEKTENWKNIFAYKLLVYIAKHFLQFFFHSMGSKGRSGVSLYIIQLKSSNGTTEYRKLLWQSLIEMYSRNIETQMIEGILYNYGNGSNQDSDGVMGNDYPFILALLKLYKEPESYYFCRTIDNLRRVFKFMEIPQNSEFDSFFKSESFRLYKTFDRTNERGLTFLEKDDVSKKAIEEYVSPLSKEEFFAIIDFFCHSSIETGFYTDILINYAFEYILIHKDFFIDALMYYFTCPYRQLPLNPRYLVALMFDKYTNDEIWSIILCAPDTMRNTWQFYFFAAMPDKYINNSHIQQWYDFLNDVSDKYLTSFGYRELLFISKYRKVDRDIIRKSMQIILSKQAYSIAAVEMYTTLLLNPLTENIDVTIEFFKDNYDLLCELYVLIATKKRQEDYHGDLLKAIYEKQPLIVDMLFERWNTNEKYLSHDDTMKLSKLFEVDDYEAVFDHIMEIIMSSDKAYLYQEDELSSMIAIANIAEQYRDRPDKWIKHYITVNTEDDRKMYLISGAILGLSEEKRIEYLTLFLSCNTKIDSFKNWQLLTLSMSWSGSEIPLIQKRIDFITRILPLLSGLKFLEHKKYIEDRISDLKQYMANVEIEEIIRGIS